MWSTRAHRRCSALRPARRPSHSARTPDTTTRGPSPASTRCARRWLSPALRAWRSLWERHQRCAQRLYAGLAEMGLKLFVENETFRLPTAQAGRSLAAWVRLPASSGGSA
ncbi:hypothetical protein FJT64_010269 [Amphibalanus amphitrite]|uniref:Uncharacterized protein n=1 Tax=Amphibalanus amphitrite TaxID=1232801 RepID=A0A6A4VQY0_AMPAM|nr:hypothetical protein FJT64_010269 [Amphibalanus amphitrite]